MLADSIPLTRFGLLRQVETEWSRDKWVQGQDNSLITDEEEQLAKDWGRILKNFNFERVITADKGRAFETALLVNHSLKVPLKEDSRLKERDWGSWSGKSIDQIRKEDPTLLESQEQTVSKFCPPGGEDNTSLVKRISLALKEAHMKFIRESILVVIHEDLIKSVISHLVEESWSGSQTTVIYLSNQLHWLTCYKGEIILERMNALPLPMAGMPH
ncbi:histidine phosphatase family protein [Thermodesulfobacteriota bacterium]